MPGDEVAEVLRALRATASIQEVMVLSICNRVEFTCAYDGTAHDIKVGRTILGFLAARSDVSIDALHPSIYYHHDRDAIFGQYACEQTHFCFKVSFECFVVI